MKNIDIYLKPWILFIGLLVVGFPQIQAQTDNEMLERCQLPAIEVRAALAAYEREMRRFESQSEISPPTEQAIVQEVKRLLCGFNDVLERLAFTEGKSIFELTENSPRIMKDASIPVFPFYHARKPVESIPYRQFQQDMSVYAREVAYPFYIEYHHLEVTSIEMRHLIVKAEYSFSPAFDAGTRTIIKGQKIEKRQVRFVINWYFKSETEQGLDMVIANIDGDLRKVRDADAYKAWYVHVGLGSDVFLRAAPSATWTSADRNAAFTSRENYNTITGLDLSPFERWDFTPKFSWGLELGRVIPLGLSGLHALDVAASFSVASYESSWSASDNIGLHSQSIDENTIRLGFLNSFTQSEDYLHGGLVAGYRYNWMLIGRNTNRRYIFYAGPRIGFRYSLFGNEVNEVSNIGITKVNGNGQSVSTETLTAEQLNEHNIISVSGSGRASTLPFEASSSSFFTTLGLALGYELQIDNNGALRLSGRLIGDYTVVGSVMSHRNRQVFYDASQEPGVNLLRDFSRHMRPLFLRFNIGLSYVIDK